MTKARNKKIGKRAFFNFCLYFFLRGLRYGHCLTEISRRFIRKKGGFVNLLPTNINRETAVQISNFQLFW